MFKCSRTAPDIRLSSRPWPWRGPAASAKPGPAPTARALGRPLLQKPGGEQGLRGGVCSGPARQPASPPGRCSLPTRCGLFAFQSAVPGNKRQPCRERDSLLDPPARAEPSDFFFSGGSALGRMLSCRGCYLPVPWRDKQWSVTRPRTQKGRHGTWAEHPMGMLKISQRGFLSCSPAVGLRQGLTSFPAPGRLGHCSPHSAPTGAPSACGNELSPWASIITHTQKT